MTYTPTNYTADTIADGEQLDADDVKLPDQGLDTSIGDRGLLAAAFGGTPASIVAAILAMVANSWVTTARIAANAVTTAKMAAGAVTSSILGDKAVTAAKMHGTAMAPPNLCWDPFSRYAAPGENFGGRKRWFNASNMDTIDPDTSNPYYPYSTRTIRMGTGLNQGGVLLYLDEMARRIGETVSFAVFITAAGGTYTLNVRAFNSSDAAIGTVATSAVLTADTTVQRMETPEFTIPANTDYLVLWWERASGSDSPKIYSRWGHLGVFHGDYPAPSAAAHIDAAVPGVNLMWDPHNMQVAPGQDFGGASRWHQPEGYRLDVTDATNPHGGATLSVVTSGAQPGKKVYPREVGLREGDWVAAAAEMSGNSNANVRIGFWTAAGVFISSVLSPTAVLTSVHVTVSTKRVQIPANTYYILVTTEHTVGQPEHQVYDLRLAKDGQFGPRATPSPMLGSMTAGESVRALSEVGRGTLMAVRAKIAKLKRPGIVTALTITNAGSGYTSAPTVGFSGGGGSGATAIASLGLVGLSITNGGSGYATPPTVTLTGGGGTGATATATVGAGAVTTLTITNRGSGYTSVPTVVFAGGGGSSAAATASLGVVALPITNGGGSYASVPTVGFTGGGGSGAAATASIIAQLVINLRGDSWMERTIFRTPLNDVLKARYGDAGAGYVGIVLGFQYQYGWVWSRSGTWDDHDMTGASSRTLDGNAVGLDGTHAVTTDLAALWNLTGTATHFVLHYLCQVGGGTLEYRLDSTGSWAAIDTDSADGYTTKVIPTGSDASHVLNLRITVAGSQGVTICGAEIQRAVPGVRFNKLGKGGSRADHHMLLPSATVTAALVAFDADLNVFMLGTNDRAASIAPRDFTAYLTSITDRNQAATPRSDNLLVMPYDTLTTTTFLSSAYDAAMRLAAVLRKRVTYLSLCQLLPDWATSSTAGLMMDALHPNNEGGQIGADRMLEFMGE